MRTGFVPSYVLESGLGKKVANLKGLERGWNYPTFLLQYIRNPGPLLLFDKLVIDEEAAEQAIKSARNDGKRAASYENGVIGDINPAKEEVNSLEILLESELFEKVNIAELITDEVYQKIEYGYRSDLGWKWSDSPNRDEYIKQFEQALSLMKEKYGAMYAHPDPERFEAMNINLIQAVSERLAADPLDDIYRMPLYEVKLAGLIGTNPSEPNRLAFEVVEQARQVLYLPSQPIHDVDKFLSLHRDKHIQTFRRKIQELAATNAKPEEIAKEIIQAEKNLMKLEFSRVNLTIGLLGLTSGAYGMAAGNFISGTLGAIAGVMRIGDEIRKKAKSKQYEWLNLVKGLLEV